MYEKMKCLVAEDGLAPSAYRGKSTMISAISRPACDRAGCCGMWGNGYQEERKMKEILMEVILHLPHDTILRLFPLSRHCHFAGVLT